jgi:hypothetical protein
MKKKAEADRGGVVRVMRTSLYPTLQRSSSLPKTSKPFHASSPTHPTPPPSDPHHDTSRCDTNLRLYGDKAEKVGQRVVRHGIEIDEHRAGSLHLGVDDFGGLRQLFAFRADVLTCWAYSAGVGKRMRTSREDVAMGS